MSRDTRTEKCCVPGCKNTVTVVDVLTKDAGPGGMDAWVYTTDQGAQMELRIQLEPLQLDSSGRAKNNLTGRIHRGHICLNCVTKIVGNIDHMWDLRRQEELEQFIQSQEKEITAIQKDTDRARNELAGINSKLNKN